MARGQIFYRVTMRYSGPRGELAPFFNCDSTNMGRKGANTSCEGLALTAIAAFPL